MELEPSWPEIALAVQTIRDANETMQGMRARVREFLGGTLAHRAHGRPRTMLDAKEAREFLFYTSLNVEHLQQHMSKDVFDPGITNRIEDILRKHFRLLRDIFRHYAHAGNTAGITMEGLLKLYQDCKLRSKDLAPHHLETIFYDQLEASRGAERLLSPQSFVEVLLQFANLKYRGGIDNVPDQFAHLIEYHLKPYACQDAGSLFQRMAYDCKANT